MRQISRLISLALLAAAAGCSGGSGQHAAVPLSAASPGQSGSGAKYRVTIRIDVPKTAGTANRRHPHYISPATTQLVVDIRQNGNSITGYPTTVALTPTSGGCTSTLANTICQLNVSLAPGMYTATLTAEDASAQALSSAQSIAFTIVQGANNTIALTLSGIPEEVDVASGARAVHGSQSGGFVLYGSAAQAFIVNARDVDGNIIVGPGAPTYAVSVLGGSGWTPVDPSASAPNTFTLTPPGHNGAGAVLRVTASYSDTTCTQPGAVCTASFSVKNDIQMLFVANASANTVTEYSPPYTGTPTTISTGQYPDALTVDAASDLFVVNYNDGTVAEYVPPYTGTHTTISTGLNTPYALTLDVAGDLFVANNGTNTVTEYAPPYTGAPTTTIGSGTDDVFAPLALGLDAARDLFVSTTDSRVVVYAPPYTGTHSTITNGVDGPQALTLDAAGDLFVMNANPANTVTEYAPPYTGAPTTVHSGLNYPYALTLDDAGDLFVANFNSSTVTEYAPPYTGTPVTIRTGVNNPRALALDAAGDLFVVNSNNTVTAYAPPYTGSPTTTVSAGVNTPRALVFTP